MDKKFSGMLEELFDYAPPREKETIHRISWSASYCECLKSYSSHQRIFDEETANDLSKRLVRAIASEDQENLHGDAVSCGK